MFANTVTKSSDELAAKLGIKVGNEGHTAEEQFMSQPYKGSIGRMCVGKDEANWSPYRPLGAGRGRGVPGHPPSGS